MNWNKHNIFLLIGLLLALVGFLDTMYLTVSHYSGSNVACYITTGCDLVTTSSYATIGGVPISLMGVGYYSLGFGLLLAYFLDRNRKILKLAILLFSISFAFSLYLVYLQFFVIEALCSFCLMSAGITTLLLILSLIEKKYESIR